MRLAHSATSDMQRMPNSVVMIVSYGVTPMVSHICCSILDFDFVTFLLVSRAG